MVHKELLEQLVQRVLRAKSAIRDPEGQPVAKVQQVQPAFQEVLDSQEPLEMLDLLVIPAHRDQAVSLAPLVRKERRARPEQLALPEFLEIQGCPGLPDRPEVRDPREQPDPPVQLATRVRKELKDLAGRRDILEKRERPAQREKLETLAPLVLVDLKVKLGRRECRELSE